MITALLAVSIATMTLMWERLSPYQPFAWGSFIFFSGASFVAYHIGQLAARATNKNVFSRFHIIFMAAKILMALSLLLIYKHNTQPQDVVFVLPFLLSYLTYMIFEVYILSQLSRMKS